MSWKNKMEPLNSTDNKIISIINTLKKPSTKIYLVGGFIRDMLSNKVSCDRDFVVDGESAIGLAKLFANKVDGYFVMLDNEYDIARVVMPDKINYIDFAKCIGKDIFEDINRRDFTINAIALRTDVESEEFLDPTGGIQDLKGMKIKAISEKNITDDPLRILRAYRFKAQLGFNIEKQTYSYIKKYKKLINNVAIERVNTELLKLLESDHAGTTLKEMRENEFLFEILPELKTQINVPPNLHHHLWLIDHSIESVYQFEQIYSSMPDWIQEHAQSEFTTGMKRIALLKLGILLHDLGKPDTWTIDPKDGRHRFIKHDEVGSQLSLPMLRRLKFSKQQIKYIAKLIKHHIYPSQIIQSKDASEKATLRMFRRLGEDTPDVIMLAMADRLATRGVEITDDDVKTNIDGLTDFLQQFKETEENVIKIPKLLSGNEVMDMLGIKPGPQLGEILKALHEAQINSDVNTKDEAIEFINKVNNLKTS